MANNRKPIKQPDFDPRIRNLLYPLMGPNSGKLLRGTMTWAKPISGFSGLAQVTFLYNPSTVQAQLSLSDASVGSSLLFPNSGDSADLRVPLSQTVQWSIMYDRTYELWGQYDSKGAPKQQVGSDNNNPAVVGVLADILQMQQFTGMTVGYQSTQASNASTSAKPTSAQSFASFTNYTNVLQLIPSYVTFGNKYNLQFYGYVTEWDFQVTHWTQFMVPMRCVININWTMLPPPLKATNSSATPSFYSIGARPGDVVPINPPPPPSKKSGTSGR